MLNNVFCRLMALPLLCASCVTTSEGSGADAFDGARFAAEARAAMDNHCDRVKVGETTDTSDTMVGESRMRQAVVTVTGCGSTWRYAVVCDDDNCVSSDILKGPPPDADAPTADADAPEADAFDVVKAAALKQHKADTKCKNAEAAQVTDTDDRMVGDDRMRLGRVKVRCGGSIWRYVTLCTNDVCQSQDEEKKAKAPADGDIDTDLGDLSDVDVSGAID
jgi:hypothetical protein